ncbi:copper homeostasis protein CutC [Agriterribacter sp.]|uniref:copper homeostasis protein CutC n=1 Tax=Agriterribacter sp. TaxID=2821509 RepID=UPI002C2B04AA|nr:copper homeostasis protein CutC [Agriterribacter sp.]HRO48110.1 copper homeostasis protein CutC [Agriterribacter sp.]HRQ17966.1 copper homeostasis protein CutC [Agriterribacter sp.]
MMYLLEVIAFTIESVLLAQQSGAHRIELCDNPAEGGTTPGYGMIKTARERSSLLLYPIIRPRGGDFLYSSEEFEIMKRDVLLCKELGCDGVVIGLLQSDGSIDKKRTAILAETAYPLGVTFHRAFDRVANPFEALEDVIACGCERILTSGLKPAAPEGAETIAHLVRQANERIIIMPGSGVRSDNIAALAKQTLATEFHSSARQMVNSSMDYLNNSMNETLQTVQLNIAEVKAMKVALERLLI